MSREIRKGYDPQGNEIELVYEGGKQVGEIRPGFTLSGESAKFEYNLSGDPVSETTIGESVTGERIEIVREVGGKPLGEVRPGREWTGERVDRIYPAQGGPPGEVRHTRDVVGDVKQVRGWFGSGDRPAGEKADRSRKQYRESRGGSGGGGGGGAGAGLGGIGVVLVIVLVVIVGLVIHITQRGTESGHQQRIRGIVGHWQVTDPGAIVANEEVFRLEELLQAGERQTKVQIVVALRRSLDGESPAAYARRLTIGWGSPWRGLDGGVVLVLVTKERKIHLEVGQRVKSVLSEERGREILTLTMQPRLESGDYFRGLDETVRALFHAIGPARQQTTRDSAAAPRAGGKEQGTQQPQPGAPKAQNGTPAELPKSQFPSSVREKFSDVDWDWFTDDREVRSSSGRLRAFRRCSGDRDKPACLVFVQSAGEAPMVLGGRSEKAQTAHIIGHYPIAFRGEQLIVAMPENIFIYNHASRMLSLFVLDGWGGELAPDGQRLAFFTSFRSGGANLWIRDMRTGARRRLTDWTGASPGSIEWSSDGSELRFEILNDQKAVERWRVDVGGSNLVKLSE
jgi:hypothetical protein